VALQCCAPTSIEGEKVKKEHSDGEIGEVNGEYDDEIHRAERGPRNHAAVSMHA